MSLCKYMLLHNIDVFMVTRNLISPSPYRVSNIAAVSVKLKATRQL